MDETSGAQHFEFGRDAEDIRSAGPLEVRCISDNLREVWRSIPIETAFYLAAERAINAATPDQFQEAFAAQDASDRAALERYHQNRRLRRFPIARPIVSTSR